MKANPKTARLTGFFLGFLGSFGGIGCIVTGLYFDGISLAVAAALCLIAAGAAAAAAGRRLFPILPALWVLACLWSWGKGTLNLGFEAFLNHISHMYDLGYGWGVIRWSTEALEPGMAQPALCALGTLLSLGICWSFLRCKGIWLTALLISAPVIPCMILTDTVPSAFYLFIQLLCLVLIFMIRLARKHHQDTALVKLLALPVAAALLVLFLCMPQKSYTALSPADTFLRHVQELFADSGKETPQTPVYQESDWINLTAVGPKSDRPTPVMKVMAQYMGKLYLKGVAFDTYRGTWWDCQGIVANQPWDAGEDFAVRITTEAIHDVFYLPYGAYSIASVNILDSLVEENGRVKNAGPWHSYTVHYTIVPGYEENWQHPADNLPYQFTQLPNSTRRAAIEYLTRELPILDTMTGVWDKANAIVRHVSQSASYSLRTEKMPGDRSDFALWFLEESDTGYCIHFASAATVLLRAAGIPARYVTGYLVTAEANRATEVTQSNAHAWVECYIDGVGWVPLEPTPGNGISQTLGGDPTESTETVTVPQTEETTEGVQQTTDPSQLGETVENTLPPSVPVTPSEGVSSMGGADSPAVKDETPAKLPLTRTPLFLLGMATVCALGAVAGQWRLRVMLRQKKRARGRRNAQALARWQEAVLHCRVRGEEPDGRLHELAQKARFSHYTVTREELREFDDWLSSSTEKLRRLGLWKRFLATVLFALY